jgi:Cys-tRNA(Pro)/Cys-tRNA(Cys) deacylase
VAPAKTNAVRLLEAAGISFELAPYDLGAREFSAEAVAEVLGLAPGRVFKTLAAHGALSTCLAVVPAGSELDRKALARAAGERAMEMLPVARLEAVTGYARGAVTALATRKAMPVYLDESAREHGTIAVSAGARGLQVLVAPDDFVAVTGAVVAPLARRRA